MAARGKSERSRHEKRRQEKPVVLIVCEGETEEQYFADIKRRFRASWIVLRNPHCSDPKGLVREAKRACRDLSKKGLRVEPWAVFDAESVTQQGARGYAEAITDAKKSGIGVANSSPCFEYWILLHYASGAMVTEPAEAERELRKKGRIPDFRKPLLPYEELWGIYSTGAPSQAANARRNMLLEDGEDPRLSRPVTYVDELMDRIAEIGR